MLTTLSNLPAAAALSLSIRHRSEQPLDGRMYLDSGPSKRGWHRLQTWIRCHHLFALNQRLHLRFRGKKAAGLGTLMHVGCAHRYARTGAKQPAKGPFLRGVEVDPIFVQERPGLVAAGKATITQDQFGLHAWVFDPNVFLTPDEAMQWAWEHDPRLIDRKADGLLDVARTIFKAYEAHWASREKMRILAVEVMLETSITSPITGVTRPYTQRLDLAWADTLDSVYIDDHKCLPARSVVETEAGPRTVGSLLGGGQWRPLGFDERTSTLTWTSSDAPVSAGVQSVYRLQTASGRVLHYGYQHPVWTTRGWVQAQDLRSGDLVAVGRLPDRPEAAVPDAALVAAVLLICDGSMTKESLDYTKVDPALRAFYLAALRDLGIEGRERFPEDGVHAPYVQMLKGEAEALCTRYDLPRVLSAEKHLPLGLQGLSQRQTGILLGAFWSGDGAMYTPPSGSVRIVYGSRSYALCCDVRRALHQMGLLTTVTSSSIEYKGERRPYHFTTVVGRESKRRFLTMCLDGTIPGPLLAEKAKALLPGLDRTGGRDPKWCGSIFWDKVTSALFVGEEECFHITAPEFSTFVADGVITHNTAAEPNLDTYNLEGQMAGLRNFGLMRWGNRFRGVNINWIKTEEPFKFYREPPRLSHEATRDFPNLIADAEDEIEWYEKSHPGGEDKQGFWKWRRSMTEHACKTRYGKCDAYELCMGRGQRPEYGGLVDI